MTPTLQPFLMAIVSILGASMLAVSWQMRRTSGEIQGRTAEWQKQFAKRDLRADKHSGILEAHGLEFVRMQDGVRSVKSSQEDLARSLLRVEGKLDEMSRMMWEKVYPGQGDDERRRKDEPLTDRVRDR